MKIKYHQIGNRAYLFGESIFTTIRCSGGIPLFYQFHRERLVKGASYLWQSPADLGEEIDAYLKDHLRGIDYPDARLRITLSVEQEKPRLTSNEGELCLRIDSNPVKSVSETHDQVRLCKAQTIRHERFYPPFVKPNNYLESILELKNNKNFNEVLFCTSDDNITEASTSNIFIYKDGVVATPKLDSHVLDGITRKIVMRTLRSHSFEVRERDIAFSELFSAEAIWLSSSVALIRPVVQLEDKEFTLGPVIFELQKMMIEEIENEIKKNEMSSMWQRV